MALAAPCASLAMSTDAIAVRAMLIAMIGVAAATWWFQLRPDLEVEAHQLEALPLQMGEWRGRALPLEEFAERMLRADMNVQRRYETPYTNEIVWVYVGYYGTRRGGRPEHTPGVCYPSAGWEIEQSRRLTVDPASGLQTNEYVVAKDGARQLVHFWYRSSRRDGLLGTWSLSLDQLRGRLSTGRADGALVRLSTPLDGDQIDAARQRMLALRRPLDAELTARWPTERPRHGEG
jgi:EpsI family protein